MPRDQISVGNALNDLKTTLWIPLWRVLRPFVPSPGEFFLLAAVGILLYIIASLFYHNSIENEVQKRSRCVREMSMGKAGGTYVVQAKNSNDEDMYAVKYNFKDKTTTLNCSCKEGNVTNTFKNIPMYNLRTNTMDTVDSKSCSCATALTTADTDTYFSGYPGLIAFMNSGGTNTAFFDTMLLNAS